MTRKILLPLAACLLIDVAFADILTYPWPVTAPVSERYSVRLEQDGTFYHPVALYSEPQLEQGPDGDGVTGLHEDRSMTYVPFARSGDLGVEARKTFGASAQRVEITPRSFGIEPDYFDGRTVRFTLPDDVVPGYVSVNFVTSEGVDEDNVDANQNGALAVRHGLVLFADRPEENAPDLEQPGAVNYATATREEIENADFLYFPPGDHHLGKKFGRVDDEPGTDARIYLRKNGQEIYMQPGAIVRGSIDAQGHDSIKLHGRGLVTGEDFHWHYFQDPDSAKGKVAFLQFMGSDDSTFDGFIVVNPPHHTMPSGDRTYTKNVKIIGWASNQDSIRPSNDSIAEQVFMKTSDDLNYARNSGQVLRDSVVWPMRNGALGMLGWNNLGSGGTTFENIRVIHSEWDLDAADKRNTGVIGSVLNQGVNQAGTRIENLYGEWGMGMLANISITYDANASPNSPDPQTGWGELGDFTFRNIILDAPFQNSGGVSVKNQLRGFERNGAKAMLRDFRFVNLVAGNTVVTDTNAGQFFDIDPATTSNIRFLTEGEFHDVAVTANAGGRVRPEGRVPTPAGMDRHISIIADPGKCIRNVRVDGQDRGRLQNVFFADIGGDHTVEVEFADGPDTFDGANTCGEGVPGADKRDCGEYLDADMPVEDRVENLLCRMSLEEKVAQLRAAHSNGLVAAQEGGEASTVLEERLSQGIGAIVSSGDRRPPAESAASANHLQAWIAENTRLGIPALIDSECLHGHHGYNSTSFPTPIAMGSSWNPALVQRAFDVAGRESRMRGSHTAHSPVLDIARDARFGRFDEAFGEDVYLVSEMGRAAVTGLQGGADGQPGRSHIIANAKHFAGYHQLEGGRNFAPTNVPRRLFLEEIARPFEVAVREASLQGIMASHNEIDGVPAHGSRWLLTELLREEWDFEGAVVSDFNDVIRLYEFQRVAESPAAAAVLGLMAGVDIDFPGGSSYRHLVELAEKDPTLLEYIDQGAARVLRAKFKLGLFESAEVDTKRAEAGVGSDESHALARSLAAESTVLLKNANSTLPVDPAALKSIAVIGPNADSKSHGPYASVSDRTRSVLQGIRDRFGGTTRISHEPGCTIGSTETVDGVRRLKTASLDIEEEGIARAVEAAQGADLAVVVMGSEHRFSMEAYYAKGHAGDRSSLKPIGNQLEMLKRVYRTGTPTVVVLMHGQPLLLQEVLAHSDAALDVFYPGQALGEAAAAMLAGDIAPGGRLSFSWPRSVGQLPVHYAQKPGGQFKHYLDESNAPLFPFGYGLAYTRFELTNLELDRELLKGDETLEFSVTVSNTGERSGQEVVQVYYRDLYAQVTRPQKQLLRFAKLALEPGESRRVSFRISATDLSFIGLDYSRITEPGRFELMVGHDSERIVLNQAFEYAR